MPRKAATVEREIYECIESHHLGDGVFFRRGTRVRRSRINPFIEALWVADGADDVEIERARYANSPEGLNPEAWANEYDGPRLQHRPMVECVNPVSDTRYITVPGLEGMPLPMTPMTISFSVGDRLPADHHFATDPKFRDCFEPVEDDDA